MSSTKQLDGLAFDASSFQPLADQLRPNQLSDVIGQPHLLADGAPLRRAVEENYLHSMVLWGPPGTGKTTLAKIIASHFDAQFITLSAVLSGVKDIRQAVQDAKLHQQTTDKATILFVDEVHRFNKAQQDAFLPHVEAGDISFIGATTENPSFELNNALLSRVRVYVLKRLEIDSLEEIVRKGLTRLNDTSSTPINYDQELPYQLALASDGDARRTLNLLELIVQSSGGDITQSDVESIISLSPRQFDNKGEYFYDQISALHKSVRGSSPDGALYWFMRMVDGGCDIKYLARRLIRMASEDIGNADPRALHLCIDAAAAYERLGSPEGDLVLAQAATYLAVAPKSNAVYMAFNKTKQLISSTGSLEVPLHLRNAPTKLMKELDYGKEYRYAHNEEGAYAAGETYLPAEIQETRLYEPVDRGMEIKIKEKLERLRELDKSTKNQ